MIEGLRYLAARPNLRTTFISDLAAMVLAQPRVLFPAVAVIWFAGDSSTVGLLAAAPAVGALLGSVFSGWLGRVNRQGLAVLIAIGSWGAAVAVFGLTRDLWLGLLFLALAGCADTVSMVFRNTMLQAAAPDDMRGRLQGVFLVVVVGGPASATSWPAPRPTSSPRPSPSSAAASPASSRSPWSASSSAASPGTTRAIRSPEGRPARPAVQPASPT